MLSLLIAADFYAQTDTIKSSLPEISIVEMKTKSIQSSKKIEKLDTQLVKSYQNNSLADLLSNHSILHIKSYGNGNIATSSMRGGNASHTAIVWNGLNIQNPMHGQYDLSLISAGLFNDVSLEYGGGSGLWGSGAIGGTIHLNNKAIFNKGYRQSLSFQVASFNTKRVFSSLHFSKSNFATNTKLYYQNSLNNYSFTDTTDIDNPNKKLNHADYTNKGLMQELYFKFKTNHHISVKLWYNNTQRNLPLFNSASVSKQSQMDENLKLNADYLFTKNLIQSVVRVGYLSDVLNYSDSAISLFSNSKTYTYIIENDTKIKFVNHDINFGANATFYRFQNANYHTQKQLDKMALFALYQYSFWQDKIKYHVSVRKEFSTLFKIPFTGSSGILYHIAKPLNLRLNYTKSYRQPTLNDLYWNPGGNPNLKPEDSKEWEGGFVITKNWNSLSVLFDFAYFNRHTLNWIIWLPGSSNFWTPRNIAEVYSRGTESKTQVSYKLNAWHFNIIVNTAYVLSTQQKSINENDQSLNQQLIYTPRYSGNGTFQVLYSNKISCTINQTYTGYRFTTTDNTSWLNPYDLLNVRLSYLHELKLFSIESFGAINNILNKDYQVVAMRPMMKRNFEIGLTLNFKKNKS